MDGAILVVSAADGPCLQTASTFSLPAKSAFRPLWLAEQSGHGYDEELLELVEMESTRTFERI